MPRHSSTAIIFDDTRTKILLQKREDFRVWGAPGGMVEKGEDYATAAIREAYEETGLIIEIIRHVADYRRPQVNGEAHVYECRVIGGDIIKQGYETVDVDWFSIKDLPKRQAPSLKISLNAVLANQTDLIQETISYPKWQVLLYKSLIKLRNLRNRFLR